MNRLPPPRDICSQSVEARQPQIGWLHLLRILSVFCMMVLHVAASQWYTVPVESADWQIFNIYDSLVRFCVPVFVMLSGTMLLDPEREYSVKKLWRKKIFRLATAFLFWSSAYAVLGNLVKYRTLNAEVAFNICKQFLLGHYHMWFLFMIAGLYMVTPFLRRVCQSRRLTQYFLVLWFLFVCVAGVLQSIPALESYVASILDKAQLSMALGFSGYYVLGYYLRKNEISRCGRVILYSLGGASVIFTIAGTYLLSLRGGEASELFYNYLFPNVCFMSVSVFLLFKQALATRNFSEKLTRLLTFLSKRSFGMYLVHDFVNILFGQFLHITTLSFCPALSVPVLSLLVFLISFCITCILAKIPLLNRYIL